MLRLFPIYRAEEEITLSPPNSPPSAPSPAVSKANSAPPPDNKKEVVHVSIREG